MGGLGGKLTLGAIRQHMAFRSLKPGAFPVALLALGLVLMVFPSLRVAGTIALLLELTYWLLAVLNLVRR